MQRDAMDRLQRWKAQPTRKPLLLYGARQVGKSWLLREFGGGQFEEFAYFDLERQPGARAAFDGDLSASSILGKLGQLQGRRIDTSNTLIVLDEVQASNRALASLKYLGEELPEAYVVAAGSLLGVAVNREDYSAPVGKVETMTLLPMSFPEFLRATGHGIMVEGIEECCRTGEAYVLHEQALELLWTYLLVGGMPEAVSTYAESGDFNRVNEVQGYVHDLYIADMAKYATPAETARIREAWASIPAQLSKENRKFQYKTVRSGGRAGTYAGALDWLETAGLVIRCVQVTSGQVPLSAQENRSAFKIYQADTGLLSCSMSLKPSLVLQEESRKLIDLGALVENYVAQALVAQGITPRYWVSQGRAEVDFIIEDGTAKAVPIEVKSSDNVRSRSLGIYCEKYEPTRALRLSTRNFGYDGLVKSIPLYAAFCINEA